MGMTDEELIEGLRKNALWVTTHDAAERIEQLLQESSRRLDLARSEGVARVIQFDRAETAEAKLATAVEELDEALNQLDSARHSVDVLEERLTDKMAKLAKALDALQLASAELLVIGVMGLHRTALPAANKAREVLAELEKTE